VEVVEVPWGGGADEAKLEQILKADTDKKIKAVAVVHNETTTGVTSDIGQVRQVSRPPPSLDNPIYLHSCATGHSVPDVHRATVAAHAPTSLLVAEEEDQNACCVGA